MIALPVWFVAVVVAANTLALVVALLAFRGPSAAATTRRETEGIEEDPLYETLLCEAARVEAAQARRWWAGEAAARLARAASRGAGSAGDRR